VPQSQAHLRIDDAHVEDQRFARQERCKLRIHGELLDLDDRRAVRFLADAHVMQRHRRERQQACIHRAVDGDLLADDAACLILEILSEIRPVDEQRRKQRHKQHYDDHSPQKDEEPAYQCKASPFGILLPTPEHDAAKCERFSDDIML
jgi:hypothetical protein